MKKILVVLLSGFFATTAYSKEKCYQISAYKEAWSKTPELICINEEAQKEFVEISLKVGLFEPKTVAIFNLNLLERVRCMDCNADHFGIANPSNSSLNKLSIKFDGNRKWTNGLVEENGTVSIGENVFYYRSL